MVVDVEKVVVRADELHSGGFNCCESVFRALAGGMGLKAGEETFKAASGFGGGIGRSGCVCGALVGAVMAAGLKHGRINANDPREPSYSRSLKLHEEFKKKFGSTCCRVLRRGEFGSAEQKARCGELVRETARLAFGILSE